MILAVVSPSIDKQHGTERAFAELMERLARDYGCEVHLFSQTLKDLHLGAPPDTFALHTSPPHTLGKIVWHKVPKIPGPHFFQFRAWLWLNRLWRWRARTFQALRFDLLLSPGINCSDADAVIVHAVFAQVRVLAQTRDKSRSPGLLKRLHRNAYYGFLGALERRVYSDKDLALAAVSPHTAQQLQEFYGRSDTSIVSNGVDTATFSIDSRLAMRNASRSRRGFADEHCVLLLIGNDLAMKGLPAVLQALSQLDKQHFKLLVVGSDDAASFRQLAERLEVSERVTFEGPAPNILDVYGCADIYVSPSLEDSFGLPVAEAMACGLPAITSNRAGVSGYIRDGQDGFVLNDPDDSASLSKIVQMLFDHRDFADRIGRAAAKTASAWTWDRNASQAWKFLNDALKKKLDRKASRSHSAAS